MPNLLIYLLESSAVLAFFYLLYVLVLRRETFFNLNRFFLLGILVFSLLFPFLSFDFNPSKVPVVEQPIEQISLVRLSYYDLMESWDFESEGVPADEMEIVTYESASSWNWKEFSMIVLMAIYVIGVVGCLSRTIWTVQWIYKLIKSSPKEKCGGLIVVKTSKPISPFSFLKYVFVHDSLINTPEFDQILTHERTHVKEKHSYDLIFVQLLAAFFWFNPVIWRLIKSLKTAHEYIADQKMMNEGYSLVEYQTLLLRQLIGNQSYGLVHNFNLTFIKKRITMMQNNKSGGLGKMKVAMALSGALLLSITIVQCNSILEEQGNLNFIDANAQINQSVNLPKWENTYQDDEIDKSNVIELTLVNEKIYLNGSDMTLGELSDALNTSRQWQNEIVLAKVDANENMKFVSRVLFEFRRFNVRKFLFEGQSRDGSEASYLKMNLPARKNFEMEMSIENDVSKHDPSFLQISPMMPKEKFAEENWPLLNYWGDANFTIDRIDSWGDPQVTLNNVPLGQKDYEDLLLTSTVDFVKNYGSTGRSNYVVLVWLDGKNSFQEFMTKSNVARLAYLTAYDEKSLEQFGQSFSDLSDGEVSQIMQNMPMGVTIQVTDAGVDVNWSYDHRPSTEKKNIGFNLDGQSFNFREGVSISKIQAREFKGQFEYLVNTDETGDIKSTGGEVLITLVREGEAVDQMNAKEFVAKKTLDMKSLFKQALPGDAFVMEFNGRPEGKNIPLIMSFRVTE